ncbi:unnamed protein product [Dicrocoelium dendriticum]|nr:unnamed protein product [Dicrocoelium dendriticum]
MKIPERLAPSSAFLCLALQLFLVLLSSVGAVNRDNFKTCKQSSFCNRQRELKVDTLFYSVVPNSITLTSSGLVALLSKHNGNQNLTLDISYLSFSTFRITVDEPTIEPKRYRMEVGDSLRDDPKSQPIDVIRSTNHLSLVGKLGDKAVLHYNPFSIEFYVDGSLVCQVNRRNLFNFEEKGDPPTPNLSVPVTQEPSISTEHSELPEPREDSTPFSPVQHNDATDGPNVDGLTEPPKEDTNKEGVTEATITPEHVVKDPHPWAETFNDHRDTRPYGPNSISMDIDFPGVSHVYGLPEHADSYVLKDTSGGDPYRLYNLDVFEYELDSQMALYGAVPVLWALNTNYTTGIFWHNPSETWVDIEYTDRPASSFLSKLPRLFLKTPERISKTRWISETGVLDVFVMLGRDPRDVSKAYSYLTGSTPLPPLFALAYHQSRWNYNDQEDVMSIDKRFDEHKIPLDVIWLDIEHTDGKRYFTWDKPKFHNPGEMVDSLKEKGRKLVTVVDPHIKQDTAWSLYNDGVANNYFVKTSDNSNYIGWCWPGSSAWPDFTSPRVRQWWAGQFLSYDPVRTDTMFTWNDMGEPSVFSGPEVTMVKVSAVNCFRYPAPTLSVALLNLSFPKSWFTGYARFMDS